MASYDHQRIEERWQRHWVEEHSFAAMDFAEGKEKEYLLVEFPYPSGDGLHVGHVRSYTALDAVARKRRMEGKNVLYPIGWDAFGLPTENYAIRTGQHPRVVTDKAIANFRRQMQHLGLSFDWTREVDTTDPAYYRWTQWIFLQLYKAGLAYQAEIPINWCPKDKIGLANEEVVNGKCERCGTAVTRRQQRQWMLKITAYADRLLADLDTVDYLEKIKTQQRNWIGRSEGAEVVFDLADAGVQKVLLATNNPSKVRRIRRLLARVNASIETVTPEEVGLPFKDVVEGSDLMENALAKAKAYLGTTDLPILGLDTGLFIDGERDDPAKVKRNALRGKDESSMTAEEVGRTMQAHYLAITEKRGGSVGAHFQDAFALVLPDGTIRTSTNVRPIHLTTTVHEPVDWHFPLRSLYTVDATGKYSVEQSEAEELDQELVPYRTALLEVLQPSITVFTTRPDTLYGATYLVLAPEHQLVPTLTTKEQRKKVEAYVRKVAAKSDLERTDLAKEKTGAFTGSYAINPVNGEHIPIWIADYVLLTYGTGAIMAVPAHDERDWAFAQQFDLPIREVVVPYRYYEPNPPRAGKVTKERRTVHAIVRNPKTGAYLGLRWKHHPWTTFPMGGVDEGEDIVAAAEREVREETGYTNLQFEKILGGQVKAEYFAAHKDENRISFTSAVLFTLRDEHQEAVSAEEQAEHEVLWLDPEEVDPSVMVHAELDVWMERMAGADGGYTGEGHLINSGDHTATSTQEARRAITAMLQVAGKGRFSVQYKLRDWIFSRQHYWGEPIPIIHCSTCGIVPVPEEQLPVELPHVDKYEPTDTGESPLAAMTDWVNVQCPTCGGAAKRETDTMPNWAGSSWYFLRYTDPHNTQVFAAKDKLAYWTPVDVYNGGMEHTTLHLLYSRFWHKFLYDQGYVPTPEPYRHRHSHGIVLAEDGHKMSKSFGNVINPDDIVREYGADTLRLYEMFMGPFEDMIPWSSRSIVGVRRFLQNVWNLFPATAPTSGEDRTAEVERHLHVTIKKVSEDLSSFRFNTAVSTLMQFVNVLQGKGTIDQQVYDEALRALLLLLYPGAPHLTAELWSQHYKGMVWEQAWPQYDPAKIQSDTVELIVQVNGKLRARITVPAEVTQDAAVAQALEQENIKKFVAGTPKKVIFVPGKILNLVV